MRKLSPMEKEFVDKLYQEQYYQLFAYAQAALGDEAAAQEAVQAAFEIACRKIEQLQASPRPSGWLWNVLKNVVKSLRRERQQMRQLLDNAGLAEVVDQRPPEENIDLLYGDLAALEEYELLKKFAVEDKPIRAIAAEAGLSINGCKQRIYRARLKLQRILSKNNLPKNKKN